MSRDSLKVKKVRIDDVANETLLLWVLAQATRMAHFKCDDIVVPNS